MLHDIDYADGMTPVFFRPTLAGGVVDCDRTKAVAP
jgi:hypothetical protein